MKNLLRKIKGGIKKMADKTFENVNKIMINEVTKYQYSTVFFLVGVGIMAIGGSGMLLYRDSYKRSKELSA